LLPPRSSFGSPGPSGLPPQAAPIVPFQIDRASPLVHFDATFSVLLLRLPRSPLSHVDHGPGRTVPRISYPALQRLRMHEPFFSPPVARRRLEAVALAPRSLTLGFGYPLDEMVWLAHPGKPLSAPNAPGLRSSELFSSSVIEKPFRVPLPPLHSPAKPYDLAPVLRRFPPTQKAVPLFAPQVFSSGRDLLLS